MKIIALFFAFFMVACSARQEVRGNIPKDFQLQAIAPGKTTRSEVIKLMGSPTAVASFNQDIWYYIGQYRTRWAFLESDIEDYSLVIIKFGADNIVQEIAKKDKTALNEIAFDSKTTPTEGTDPSVLKQLLGNVGKFNNQNTGVPSLNK